MRLHLDLINIDADTIDHVEIEDLADIEAAHAYAQSAGDCVLFEIRDAAENWEGADEDLYAYAIAHVQ